MLSLCLSPSPSNPLTLHNKSDRIFIRAQNPRYQCKVSSSRVPRVLNSVSFNPLRFGVKGHDANTITQKKGRGFSVVCYAGPVAVRNMQWISAVSSVVLMLTKGTSIHKSFLVPLLALQAPSSVISWMKGNYGIWTAFVALLVRIFFFIPGYMAFQHVSRAGRLQNAFEQGSIVPTLSIICVTVISCLILI